MEKCENCKFADEPGSGETFRDWRVRFICRRFPPQVVRDNDAPGWFLYSQPGVQDSDWCGEWAGQEAQ